MDTSAYLMELAQKFQLSSFDGDLSHLNSSDASSSSSVSPDQSSADISADTNLFTSRVGGDGGDQSHMDISTTSSLQSPAAPTFTSKPSPTSANESKQKEQSEREGDLRIKYEQLKKNLRKQGEELERTTKNLDEAKHAASRDRSEYEERIRHLEHNHALLESQYQKSILEFNHNLSVKQNELTNVTNTLRTTQLQLQDANPDILKQIEYVKDDLTDLYISEAMYLEYSAIERHRQTIREYVCCSVYELVRAEKNAKESMNKELEMIRTKLIKVEDESERNARERDQLAKLKRVRETELTAELQHFETLNAKLHEELTKKTVLINELQTKGELYDSLRAKCERLEEDYSLLQQKDLMQTISVKSLSEEKEQTSSKVFHLEKEKDLLRMDKMYLTKEVERLTECYRNSEKDKERQEVKLLELKRAKEDLVEKLVKVREEHQTSYEEKLNQEMDRLHKRTASDLDSIRLNQREAFEREIAGLKESREMLSKELEKLRTTYEGQKEDYTALQEEHRRLLSQLETERTDARNALKLKSFEYERLALTYEETMSDFRKLKIEHEVINKKQSVLKQEFYTLQGDTQKKILELEASEKNLQEKLSMYQQLEYELDMAILNAGGVEQVQDKAALQGGQIRGIHHMMESLGSNIPTANKRRIKQSILLAQQLIEKQKMIEGLTKEVTFFKEKAQDLETELTSAKQSLSFVSQPHNYLIQSLQAKEEELLSAQKRATELGRTLSEREAELKRAIVLKTQLEGDLHRLLAGKTQLDELKEALVRGQHRPPQMSLQDQQALDNFKENTRPQPQPQATVAASARSSSQQQPHATWKPHHSVDERQFQSLNDPKQQFYQPLSNSQGRSGTSSSGDAHIDQQPQPLWFRKLTR